MKKVNTLSITELKKMAESMYGNLVKAVVDIQKNELVVDAEMHADEEQYMLENGSKQSDLWGINLYPDKFDSMINIRPRQKNMSRDVEDTEIRGKIISLVRQKVIK